MTEMLKIMHGFIINLITKISSSLTQTTIQGCSPWVQSSSSRIKFFGFGHSLDTADLRTDIKTSALENFEEHWVFNYILSIIICGLHPLYHLLGLLLALQWIQDHALDLQKRNHRCTHDQIYIQYWQYGLSATSQKHKLSPDGKGR